MNFRRILKFAFPGALLAAGVYAYADGDVMLKDGTIISWSEFAYAINNPTTVKGTLPEDSPVLVALQEAKDALQEKGNAVSEISDSITEIGDSISTYNTAVENAIKSRDEIADVVAEKKKAYDDAEAQLSSWRTQMTDLNTSLNQLSGQSSSLLAKIEQAKSDLDAAKEAYEAVGTTSQTTTTTIVPWLKTVYDDANAYLKAWNDYMKDDVNGQFNIYYRIAYTIKKPNRKVYSIVLSFAKPDIYDENDSWNTATSIEDFYIDLYPEDVNNGDGITFSSAEIYLGQGLKDLNGKSVSDRLSFTPPSNDDLIISGAVEALKGLTTTSGYYTTTVTNTTTYNDPDGTLKKAVEDAQKKLNSLRAQSLQVTDNIDSTNESISELQGEIDGYTKVPNGSAEGTLSEQAKLKKAWDDQVEIQNAEEQKVTTAQNGLSYYEKKLTNKQSELSSAENQVTLATIAVNKADSDVATAQAEVDAAAFTNYNTVTLTEDIATEDTVIESYSGTVWGEGHIFTAINSPIFLNFNGQIHDAAVNGQFSKVVIGAKYGNFARWDVENNTGRFYSETGAESEFETLGELGFAARNSSFGVDFEKDIIVPNTETTKVYKITVYEVNQTPVEQYVTINSAKKFVSDHKLDGFTIPVNNFAKSATVDLKGIANVFYEDNTCDNAVIEDRVSFYCPVDLAVSKVDLKRTFTKGYNSVCLPFEMKYDYNPSITELCTYERETTEKFWFTKVAESIPANTPILLVADDDFTLDLSDVSIMATPEKQIVMDEGAADEPSKSFGTLKTAGIGEFQGQSNSYRVYGLTKDGTFKYASENSTFPAFRTVIYSELARPTNAPASAPRLIGILDEKGIEITGPTTEIESVADGASSLEIIGGQGEISITSETNYGNLQIFTIDGRLAATANVVEGTTYVSLAHGLYIVMGQKVLVK